MRKTNTFMPEPTPHVLFKTYFVGVTNENKKLVFQKTKWKKKCRTMPEI